jgi:hypothetical protein
VKRVPGLEPLDADQAHRAMDLLARHGPGQAAPTSGVPDPT